MSNPNEIHPELTKVFEHFKDDEVAIVGSALRDFDKARDIDVVVPSKTDYPALVKRLGATYSGWDLADGSHLRRANLKVPGVGKRVQLLQNRLVHVFEDWPHAVLLRDGKTHNKDTHFSKQKSDPSYVGWKKRPSTKVPSIYSNYGSDR